MPFAALVSTSSASVITMSLVALENGMEFICILRWHFLGTFASVPCNSCPIGAVAYLACLGQQGGKQHCKTGP